jgi:hypothetical protein
MQLLEVLPVHRAWLGNTPVSVVLLPQIIASIVVQDIIQDLMGHLFVLFALLALLASKFHEQSVPPVSHLNSSTKMNLGKQHASHVIKKKQKIV